LAHKLVITFLDPAGNSQTEELQPDFGPDIAEKDAYSAISSLALSVVSGKNILAGRLDQPYILVTREQEYIPPHRILGAKIVATIDRLPEKAAVPSSTRAKLAHE